MRFLKRILGAMGWLLLLLLMGLKVLDGLNLVGSMIWAIIMAILY